jgi:peptidoglycan/xylan/chitin deacetylase (PgdA/CDA1 family)
MPYLMIHDMQPGYFDLALDDFQLTFDDGLFSQYYYYPLLRQHPEKLIYFITTSFIKPGRVRKMYSGDPIPHLKSKKYMHRTFIQKETDHFMTTEEVQYLAAQPNVEIGVHSHFHDVIPTRTHARKRKPPSQWKLARFNHHPDIHSRDLSIRSRLAFQGYDLVRGRLSRRTRPDWEAYIEKDTRLAREWMTATLGFVPDLYCFPFNEYSDPFVAILKRFGFKEFFGARVKKQSEIKARTDIDSLMTG